MKKHTLLCIIALILSSCSTTNEEKAEKLIAESLKGSLYHPDTYEPISTKVDSAFVNFENLIKLGDLCDELFVQKQKQDELKEKQKSIERLMSIYAPNGQFRVESHRVTYEQYKEEYDEVSGKLNKITPKIANTISEIKKYSTNLNSEEFTGWIVTHRFTSKNGANTVTLPGNMVFICDKDFTNCGSGIDFNFFSGFILLINKIQELDDDEIVEEVVSFIQSSQR